ncbi:hypothetical protein QQO24_14335 [Ralstonia pseudosolanacearum]|uniref:hypothetical protein n=1 Tax=Ralstonia pseudosolanacearum TaxID=1310165 RepID=UPI0018D073E8|nr:hypothetical protein [Ralstonia pseudosolanacearum]MDN3368344.1 hypothetical protein [Ralstonia pseudosolanacearum]
MTDGHGVTGDMAQERPENHPNSPPGNGRRYTAVRIAIGLAALQSAFAIFNFVCWLLRGEHPWAELARAYPVSRMVLWGAALLWSAVSLASVIACWQGRRWGRLGYLYGAAAWIAVAFLLAPWQIALSGAVMPLLIWSVFRTDSARCYLAAEAVSRRDRSMRARLSRGVWLFSTAYYYAIFFVQVTNEGWLADVLVDEWRRLAMWIMPLLPLVAVGCTRKGERLWRFGMFLVVSGLAGLFALIGYVPYMPQLVSFLGDGYQGYEVPWGTSIVWVVLLLLIGSFGLPIARLLHRRRASVRPEPT